MVYVLQQWQVYVNGTIWTIRYTITVGRWSKVHIHSTTSAFWCPILIFNRLSINTHSGVFILCCLSSMMTDLVCKHCYCYHHNVRCNFPFTTCLYDTAFKYLNVTMFVHHYVPMPCLIWLMLLHCHPTQPTYYILCILCFEHQPNHCYSPTPSHFSRVPIFGNISANWSPIC